MRFIGLLVLSLIAVDPAAAQEPVRVSLDDAIRIALSDGYDANDILLQLQRAQELERAASGSFRTNADLDLLTPDFRERFDPTIDPATGATSYFSRRTTQWFGQLSVNQPLPTNGRLALIGQLEQLDTANLEAGSADARDFLTSLQLNLTQPLFVPNTLKLNLERAKLELERSEMRYTRTQLDVIYNATDAFFGFHRALERADIAADTVQQQERSYQLAKTKYDAGLIPEVEALQMQVDLAQSQADLVEAQGSAARAEESFKITLGLDLDTPVAAEANLVVSQFSVDEAVAIEHGLRNRSEIREGQIGRRLSEITLKETDARRTIRGELTAFYDITGRSSLGSGASTRSLFDASIDDLRDRPNNKGLAFSLNVPLWDSGVNGAEVAAARINLERSDRQMEQDRRVVIQQIRAALTLLEESRQRLDVLAQSEDVARRSYEISLARFENGEITTQDLALDRDRLTQARLAYLDAYIGFQLASADLERQTLYDFAENRSLVAE